MRRCLCVLAVAGLVACGGAAASAPAEEAASPIEPPAPTEEPVAWDGGDVCAFDPSSPPPPCARRRRFGRPNRVYAGEIEALERLLAETPAGTRDHEAILLRLASDYLDLACIAFSECVRGGANGVVTRPAIQAGETARAAHAKLRARCERHRSEYPLAPRPEVCP